MIPCLTPVALLAAAPRAVQLFTSEPPAPPPTDAVVDHWSVALWITAAALVLGVSAAVSIMAWRGRWREPPITRALNTLTAALHLRADAKAVLHRLAKAIAAEPVALLLSESAFEHAVTALEAKHGTLDQRDKAALLALRANVFGIAHEARTTNSDRAESTNERPPLNIAA